MATAIGTSIDALAVGVSLAFLDVNIIIVALAIGFATFVMPTGGMIAVNLIGAKFGRWAGRIGGIALVGLGISIQRSNLTTPDGDNRRQPIGMSFLRQRSLECQPATGKHAHRCNQSRARRQARLRLSSRTSRNPRLLGGVPATQPPARALRTKSAI